MRATRGYVIAVAVILALVLLAAEFINGGEHFQTVALICAGFAAGWIAAFASQRLYRS